MIGEATLKKELKVLKRIFNVAIDRRYLVAGANPCAKVPVPKVAKTRPVYVSVEEFTASYTKASSLLWRSLVLLWYSTGLRRAEAMHLMWDDIDLVAEVVVVSRHVQDRYVRAWSPKDHELRTISIARQLVDLLRQLKSIAPKGCPYVFMESGRWVHVREKVDVKQWSDQAQLLNNLLRRFQTLCRQAGVREYEIHGLRRSCITNWARNGLPIHVAQAFAGHSDIATTQEHYLSVQTDDFAVARKHQEDVLGGKGGISDVEVTDPEVTPKARKREFAGRKIFAKSL